MQSNLEKAISALTQVDGYGAGADVFGHYVARIVDRGSYAEFEEVKHAYYVNYIARSVAKQNGRLNILEKDKSQAESILFKSGEKSTGQLNRRTRDEEKQYGAARVGFHKVLKKAGVPSLLTKDAGNTHYRSPMVTKAMMAIANDNDPLHAIEEYKRFVRRAIESVILLTDTIQEEGTFNNPSMLHKVRKSSQCLISALR